MEHIPAHIKQRLLEAQKAEYGVKFDFGCGDMQLQGFIGVDRTPSPYVDICLDLEHIPYDIPDECASLIVAGHIVEHIKPWLFFNIMNEWWRISKLGCQLAIATPYGGSMGYWADPTHMHGFNEVSFKYFDPLDPHAGDSFHTIYKPKPWHIEKNTWDNSGTLEILLKKIPDDPSYHKMKPRPSFYEK